MSKSKIPEFVSYNSIEHGQFDDLRIAYELVWDDTVDSRFDCPTEWISPDVAVMSLSKPYRCDELDNIPDDFDPDTIREFADGNDEAEQAFRRHYERKGWQVGAYTLHGCCQSDWHEVAVAIAPGYGTPREFADTFEDWLFGNVYTVHFYGLYSFGGERDWAHIGSLSGVYLTSMTPDECKAYLHELCEECDAPEEIDAWRKVLQQGKRAA